MATALFIAAYIYVRFTIAWKLIYKFLLALFLSISIPLVWTFCFASFLGAWYYAISYPIFICWILGSLSCFLVVLTLESPKGLLGSLGIFGLAIIVLGVLYVQASQPEPGLVVLFETGVTNNEINEFWSEYICIPTGRGEECRLANNVSQAGAYSEDGYSGVLILFWDGTDRSEIDRVKGNMLSSPLVFRIEDYP